MLDVLKDKDMYLASYSRLEKSLGQHGRAPLHRLRESAIERFAELGFPTSRNEDWKFTNLTPLLDVPFQPAGEEDVAGVDADEIAPFTFGAAGEMDRLVFVNGFFAADLSSRSTLPAGVIVTSLADALRRNSDLVLHHLARHAPSDSLPFTALNTAFLRDGAFVYLPKGAVLARPLHLLFLATGKAEPTNSYPRALIVAEQDSRASIVEGFAGPADQTYFTNAVTEVVVGPGAAVDHYKLQQEGGAAFHIANLHVRLDRASRFSSHLVSLGGQLVRNEIHAVLDAEGSECTLNGLYRGDGRQHVDNHTVIDHARPHCASHELYKGILDGKAHGVFNGKIFVRQDAQKTDAKQTNQTLLLSDDAVIDTKPQLEIYADDVKCTHGATVGQLEEEALFYLRSRGINLEDARNLLTFAFANDIVGRIQVRPLRVYLEEMMLDAQHLPHHEPGGEGS